MWLLTHGTRWAFGVILITVSLAGFASGDFGLALFVLVSGSLLLPPVWSRLRGLTANKTNSTASYQVAPKVNQKQNYNTQYPDRTNDIGWHREAINKAMSEEGDLDAANLSYAKLEESIRQQSVNEPGKHDFALEQIKKEYAEFRKTYNLEYPQQFAPRKSAKVTSNGDGLVLNPKAYFKLTIFNAPQNILQEVRKILSDDNQWNKQAPLLPLFTQYNIKCVEIEEYISKYKAQVEQNMDNLRRASQEYNEASEMDKREIDKEFLEEALKSLYERAACNLEVLFTYSEIDLTLDDQLIREYGFDTVANYMSFAYDYEKVHYNYERKDFEDLIKAGLVYTSEEIPLPDILSTQTLKVLNSIARKEENHFKRKAKAIEYILENEQALNNIGKHISMRRVFRIKPLPEKYKSLNISDVSKSWAYVKEYIRLLVDTYHDAKRYSEDIRSNAEWVKSYSVEKHEDFNPDFICLKAREVCARKYTKSSPPKVPFHVGCNCDVRINF